MCFQNFIKRYFAILWGTCDFSEVAFVNGLGASGFYITLKVRVKKFRAKIVLP